MKKFLSIVSFISLLFLPIQLSCSDNDDDFAPIQKSKQIVTKKENIQATQNKAVVKIDTPVIKEKSTLQKIYAALTSDEVQSVAQGTASVATAVVSTIGKIGYQGIQLAAEAYNKNNHNTESYIKKNIKDNSDSESDSDSEFQVVASTVGKPHCFRNEEELQKSLNEDPDKTMHHYNRFIKQSYTDENPQELEIQLRISEVITVAQKGKHATGETLSLAPATAHSYQPQQEAILLMNFDKHARITAPNITNERNAKITEITKTRKEELTRINEQFERKQAQIIKKYNKKTYKMGRELRTAHENLQYLNHCAGITSKERSISPSNFTDPEKLHKLLAEQLASSNAKPNTTLPEQNNHASRIPAIPESTLETMTKLSENPSYNNHQQIESTSIDIDKSSENQPASKNKKGKKQ